MSPSSTRIFLGNVSTTNRSQLEVGLACEYLEFAFKQAEEDTISLADTIFCVINGVFGVIALVANILVLYALYKASSLHPPSKALLCSLALSDLGVGVIVQPLFVAYRWAQINGHLPDFCVAGMLSHVGGSHFSAVSFLTMTAISMDRLLALLLRIRYHTIVTFKRVIIALVIIWIGGGLWASSWATNQRIYSLVTIFVIPVCFGITVFAYIKIYFCLRRQTRQMMNHVQPFSSCSGDNNKSSQKRYRRSVVGMFYLFCFFTLSYLPYLSHKCLVIIVGWRTSTSVLFSFALTLVYLNSFLNPLIYCWRMAEINRIIRVILYRTWMHVSTTFSFCKMK